MRRNRYTAEQMARAVARVEAGAPLEEVCRRMGIGAQISCRSGKKLARPAPSEAKRLERAA